MIRQGNTGLPPVVKLTPADAHGSLLIQGKPAIWVNGLEGEDGWHKGVLAVAWEPTEDSASGLPRTFALYGKQDDFELDELVQFAKSAE